MTTTMSDAAPGTAVAAGRTLRTSVPFRDTLAQTFTLAWRAIIKLRRNPEQLLDVTLMPLMLTAMFGYVFGGAVAGGVASYLPTLIPGIMAWSALTACMAAGIQLREDMDNGVFDRFRSLPIARIAPLAGPMVADLARYCLAGTAAVAIGLVMGYRPGGGALGVAAGLLLAIVTGWSLAWIFTWIGTIARSAAAVQGMSVMILFPLVFLSNAFVPVDTLPGWLKTVVNANPVSHVVSALRDLMNKGAITIQVVWALTGCAVVVAIFVPLAVRSYSKKL
jgi:ABC-2 type transport system permease protein